MKKDKNASSKAWGDSRNFDSLLKGRWNLVCFIGILIECPIQIWGLRR